MYRPKGFKNPYGEEWFTSSCQHQYNLGEAYELGFNACLEALKKEDDSIFIPGAKTGADPVRLKVSLNNEKGWYVFIPDEVK